MDVASFTYREPEANATNTTNGTQPSGSAVDGFVCHTPVKMDIEP